ncbi:MAG: 4Fe-4S binding protein [Desulfobacterales bacterium]
MKEKNSHSNAKRYGMVIDLDKCTGCGACMVACYSENNVPFKTDETNKLDSINWIRVFKLTNNKPYPDTEVCYLLPCPAVRRGRQARPFPVRLGMPGCHGL